MIGWIIVGAVVVLLVLWAVGVYNGLIKLRNLVQEAWRQIDVELKRRHDLIGNLVETVKGYAAHERGTLEDVDEGPLRRDGRRAERPPSRPRARVC